MAIQKNLPKSQNRLAYKPL